MDLCTVCNAGPSVPYGNCCPSCLCEVGLRMDRGHSLESACESIARDAVQQDLIQHGEAPERLVAVELLDGAEVEG